MHTMASTWQDHPQKTEPVKARPTQKADVNHRQNSRVSAQGSEAESYQEDKEKVVQTLDLSLRDCLAG